MSEYRQIVEDHVEKLRKLRDERLRIEREIKSVRELLRAAVNLMPEDEKGPFLHELAKTQIEQMSLTEEIRKLLQSENRYLTAPEIKEKLEMKGYDFSAYKSNPLSSVHSILKRFKPSDIEVMHWTTGTANYRWKKNKKK